MKQIWFKPPFFRQFSLSDDAAEPASVPRAAKARSIKRRLSASLRFKPHKFILKPRIPTSTLATRDLHSAGGRVSRGNFGFISRLARAVGRKIDKYGYYAAVGICALMVFIGAAAGIWGFGGLNAQPSPTPRTGSELTSDISSAQASSGGLIESDIDASASVDKPRAKVKFKFRPVDGEIITNHATDKLIFLKTLNIYGTHAGIDIAGGQGQVVTACTDGVIARCWRESLLGNVIEIRADDGLITRYANLMSLELAKEGARVAAGDAIGAIGASAMSESLLPSHLHFEVLSDDVSVPPLNYLP